MIRPPTCPICSQELVLPAAAESPLFPFCSPRCKQIDLGRWIDGKYAVVEPLDGRALADLDGIDPDAFPE